MTISLAIKQNDIFVRKDALYRFAMQLPQQRMLFMPLDPDRGPEFIWTENDFEKHLASREIRSHEVVRDANGDIIIDGDRADLDPRMEGSKKANDGRALFFFLKKWHESRTSLYHPALDDFVLKYSAEARRHDHHWLPSAGALHRAINKFPDIEQLTARFLISKSGEFTRERWHPRVGRILEEIIDWYWEQETPGRNKLDAEAYFDSLFNEVAKIIARDTVFEGPLKKPSRETVRAYINSAECYETVARKFGKQRADANFSGNVHPVPAKKLLEVVLIDSTVMDTWCVLDDETLLPLGRPTLTIAIDVFTRMILAAIISFEPPSLYTAMACLKRVNMPKEDVNERWKTVFRKSDGWGKPGMVVVDNELAQTGKSYQSACEDAKISVRWAPVARPQYKAVVERFFLTLKKILLDKLPGGLPHKPEIMKQLGIDPREVATITLDKLSELVNMAIHDVYHYEPHSTIGVPPALAWEKSKQKNKRPFIGDVEFLERAFGALRAGTLTTSGIKFENMIFHDPQITGQLLDDLACMAPRRDRRKSLLSSLNPQLMFKYNPANVEAIYVWNSHRKEYTRLPNISREATAGLSIWHWRILRIWAEQESIAFSSPAEQAAARRRLREAVEEKIPAAAYGAVKKLRRVLNEPSKLVEGNVTRMTQAPPTVGGMAADDVEIDVAAFAPEGDRIPPPGPARGRRSSTKRDERRKARSRSAVQREPANATSRTGSDNVLAAFAADMRSARPTLSAMVASKSDMSLEEFFSINKRNS